MDEFSDLPELLGAVPAEPRDLFYWVKMFCVFIHRLRTMIPLFGWRVFNFRIY